MTTLLPFVRRRLVLDVAIEPTGAKEPGAATGATDAELAHLATRQRDLESARWDVWLGMYGARR